VSVDVDSLDLAAVDLFSDDFQRRQPDVVAAAREQHWLARSDLGYLALTYRSVHSLLRHPDFRFATATLVGDADDVDAAMLARSRRNLLHRHGEHHTQFRKLVNRAFTPRTVERLRDPMRELFNRIVDPACARGSCEFVREVAFPYPPQMICALLGVDVGRWEQISDWVEVLFESFQLDPSKRPLIWATQQELDAAMLEVVERKRVEPGDDLVSDLIAVDADGERLSDRDIATLAENIITAGTDTTRNELACGMFDLATRPDQRDKLRDDRSLLPSAVEEILRFRPVVPGTMREAVTDVEFDGVRFPAGTVVMPVFTAANRDPDVYPDPDRFDITREHAQQVMSFGGGPHFCLGAALARAELQEALDIILDRMPDFEIEGEPNAVSWKPMVGIGGPEALPLRFTPGR
jgi:cytochrome P450